MEKTGLVTVREAQKQIGVSRELLYKFAKQPGIPGIYRFGRAVRFDLAQFLAWARTQR